MAPHGIAIGGIAPSRSGSFVQTSHTRLPSSTRALDTSIRDSLALTNAAPTPCVWTKTAENSLARVAREGQRRADSSP